MAEDSVQRRLAAILVADVVDAVRCAVAFQDGMAERNADVPEGVRIEFRIGVNLGDVIVQDDDVFGDGVNAPALVFRTASHGASGQMEEAKASAQALLDFFPAFSLAGFRSLSMFKNPDDTERLIGALREAGLPE